jgi:hypothetical protein
VSQTPSYPSSPEPGGPSGPQQPPASSTSGGSRRGLVIVLAVLVVLVVGAGAVLLFTGDDDDDDTASGGGEDTPAGEDAPEDGDDSPEAAVTSYFEAFADGDCDQMAGLLTDESLVQDGQTAEETVALCEQSFEDTRMDLDFTLDDVTTVSEEDDTATVEVTATAQGQTNTQTVPLVREDGRWKIDGVSFTEDAEEIEG